MTPKEKASELVQKITDTIFDSGNTVSKPMVKDVALICAEQVIFFCTNANRTYWQEVKSEIEKL